MSSITLPSISDLLDEWAAAWSSHDMDRVAALFTDDCTYEDVTLVWSTTARRN